MFLNVLAVSGALSRFLDCDMNALWTSQNLEESMHFGKYEFKNPLQKYIFTFGGF
jgi:hypothetical protein